MGRPPRCIALLILVSVFIGVYRWFPDSLTRGIGRKHGWVVRLCALCALCGLSFTLFVPFVPFVVKAFFVPIRAFRGSRFTDFDPSHFFMLTRPGTGLCSPCRVGPGLPPMSVSALRWTERHSVMATRRVAIQGAAGRDFHN